MTTPVLIALVAGVLAALASKRRRTG